MSTRGQSELSLDYCLQKKLQRTPINVKIFEVRGNLLFNLRGTKETGRGFLVHFLNRKRYKKKLLLPKLTKEMHLSQDIS